MKGKGSLFLNITEGYYIELFQDFTVMPHYQNKIEAMIFPDFQLFKNTATDQPVLLRIFLKTKFEL